MGYSRTRSALSCSENPMVGNTYSRHQTKCTCPQKWSSTQQDWDAQYMHSTRPYTWVQHLTHECMTKMVVEHIRQPAEHGAGGRVVAEVFDDPDGQLFCHARRHKVPVHTQDSADALNSNQSNCSLICKKFFEFCGNNVNQRNELLRSHTHHVHPLEFKMEISDWLVAQSPRGMIE